MRVIVKLERDNVLLVQANNWHWEKESWEEIWKHIEKEIRRSRGEDTLLTPKDQGLEKWARSPD